MRSPVRNIDIMSLWNLYESRENTSTGEVWRGPIFCAFVPFVGLGEFSRSNVQFALRYQLWAFGDPSVLKTDWTFLQEWPNMPLLGNQCRSFPDRSCTHRQTCSQTWPNVKNSEHLTAQQCLWRHNSNGLHRRVTKLGSLFVCVMPFKTVKSVWIYLVKCMRERVAEME
jgi:hypothetical protein